MKANWALIAIAGTFTFLLSINPIGYAWHENLGIDANKAAELYQTKPNDPAIVQWKNALQLAINGMGKCFDLETAVSDSCQTLMSTISSNCNSHPNELLACSDTRIAQIPEILKNVKEELIRKQKEAYEPEDKAFQTPIQQMKAKFYSKEPQAVGGNIIDSCIKTPYGPLDYYAKNVFCDGELRFLQKECQTKSNQFEYCQDQRLVGYLKKYSSTVTPYSNTTGNSSTSNSTYP